ncbi:MAG: adenylate kinase [Candidatus Dormibacteria bacterium]
MVSGAARGARHNLVIVGPAGSGKGTQAAFLKRSLGVEHLATGDMLREERARGTELGQRVVSYLDAGKLVPDDVIVAMIRQRLEETPAGAGFVLDGFPRTVAQARSLQEMLADLGRPLDLVIVLEVPTDDLVARLARRAVLEKRGDDTPSAIAERLRLYHEQTEPVLDYLGQTVPMVRLDGTRSIEQTNQLLLEAIG